MSKVKVKKDNSPVIYKQDIIENGKLNVVGTFLLLAAFMGAINIVSKYLSENIVDKDKVN